MSRRRKSATVRDRQASADRAPDAPSPAVRPRGEPRPLRPNQWFLALAAALLLLWTAFLVVMAVAY